MKNKKFFPKKSTTKVWTLKNEEMNRLQSMQTKNVYFSIFKLNFKKWRGTDMFWELGEYHASFPHDTFFSFSVSLSYIREPFFPKTAMDSRAFQWKIRSFPQKLDDQSVNSEKRRDESTSINADKKRLFFHFQAQF